MSAKLVIPLEIRMESDWAIGSGTGRQGSLDSLVERDLWGLPLIPATTLRGMWRDAAETVAYGLDDGDENGPWGQIVDHLFGSQPAIEKQETQVRERWLLGPVPSRLTIADARYPDAFGQWLHENGKSAFCSAACFVKPGVEINPDSGRARDKALRFDEFARKGALLHTETFLDLCGDDEHDSALVALALASLLLLERLGGDRRRGAGKCKIVVGQVRCVDESAKNVKPETALPKTQDEAVSWLEDHQSQPPTDLGAIVENSAAVDYQNPDEHAAFSRYALDVEILSPTTIADEVQGNVVTTLRYIPGVYLLHVAVRLAAALGLDRGDVDAMISCGDIRVLPAYPVANTGDRALPLPSPIEKRKVPAEGKPLFHNRHNGKPDGAFRRQDGAFCVERRAKGVVDGMEIARKVTTLLRTHNSVDDESQKPKQAAGGGVFVLESLKPATTLRSELWIRRDLRLERADFTSLSAVEPIPTSVGRAKKAGYGKIEVRVGNRLHDRDEKEIIAAIEKRIATAGEKPKVGPMLWIVSDIVLPQGRTNLDEAVRQLLWDSGARSKTDPDAPCEVDFANSDIRSGRVEGWVGRWNLPRPTLITIKAGSVICLAKGNHAPDPARLARLESLGLGDRRAEGFGQVVVEPALLRLADEQLNGSNQSVDRAQGGRDVIDVAIPPNMLTEEEKAHVKVIEDAALRAALAAAAEHAVASPEARREWLGWERDQPNMSQLGNLRSVIGKLDQYGSVGEVHTFLKSLIEGKREGKWGGKAVVEKAMKFVHETASSDRTDAEQRKAEAEAKDRLWTALMPEGSPDALQIEKSISRCLVTQRLSEAKQDHEIYRGGIVMLFHAAMRAHKRDMERSSHETQDHGEEAVT